MKIKRCVITNISEKELYDVETICFAQDIVWCGSGKEHIGISSVSKIRVSEDLSITSDSYSELPTYTADEFIKKFDGKSDNKPKYRIKTKKEFIEEFGKDWRNQTGCTFVDSMDFLLGRELTESQANGILKNIGYTSVESWNISDTMITKINPKAKPKHRIKTREEFIKEFGEHWVSEVGWNSDGKMDYLLGHTLTREEEKEYSSNSGDIRIDSWCLNENTITEIKQTPISRRRKVSLIDRFLPVPKVSLNHSLYRRRKTERVNLDQYN